MSTTVTVPNNVVEAWRFFDRNHIAIIGVLVVALLASIVTEVVKRKYNARQLKQAEVDAVKLSKKATAWILTASTTAFTAIGYVLFLYQQNKGFVAQIPYIGEGVTQSVGVAYLLYSLRLNKSYQTFATWASKWSKTKPTESNLPQPAEPTPAAGDDLA